MSSTVVHVANISSQTSDQEVRDFFSFCGKITSLAVKPESAEPNSPKSATVTFEKENAAKTALLLNSTQLGPSEVHVTPASTLDAAAAAAGIPIAQIPVDDEDDIPQDEKPRTRVLAEYLAHGYVISDQAIQHAIALDSKHGFSSKFTSTLQTFDDKVKASERAKQVDQNYGLTERANTSWRGLHSYFQKAIGTDTGRKLMDFYTQTEKQVLDVHAEARRLADLKQGAAAGTQPSGGAGSALTTCQCGGDSGTCACAEGKCNCAGCSKGASADGGVLPAPPTAAAVPPAAGVPAPVDNPAAAPQTTGNS